MSILHDIEIATSSCMNNAVKVISEFFTDILMEWVYQAFVGCLLLFVHTDHVLGLTQAPPRPLCTRVLSSSGCGLGL